jgi:hypothetical protein
MKFSVQGPRYLSHGRFSFMNLKIVLSVIALIVQITAGAESQTTQKGLGPNCSDLYQPRVRC